MQKGHRTRMHVVASSKSRANCPMKKLRQSTAGDLFINVLEPRARFDASRFLAFQLAMTYRDIDSQRETRPV